MTLEIMLLAWVANREENNKDILVGEEEWRVFLRKTDQRMSLFTFQWKGSSGEIEEWRSKRGKIIRQSKEPEEVRAIETRREKS